MFWVIGYLNPVLNKWDSIEFLNCSKSTKFLFKEVSTHPSLLKFNEKADPQSSTSIYAFIDSWDMKNL